MSELSAKQEKAAIMLAAGVNCIDVAKNIKVTPETISVWKKNLIFEALINDIRYESLLSAREQMRNLCADAVGEIQNLMRNADSEAVRLKASLEVLKLSGLSDSDNFGWGNGSTNPLSLAREKAFYRMSNDLGVHDAG